MKTTKNRSPTLPAPVDFPPDAVRERVRELGWTMTALAKFLGVTRSYLLRRIRETDRPRIYTELFWSLPPARQLKRVSEGRRAMVERLLGNAPTPIVRKVPTRLPGYRWHDYLFVGAVVQATTDVGSLAHEGARGIVLAVEDVGDGERYGIVFETGGFDWFDPDHVDQWLADIGLEREALRSYRYATEDQVRDDFDGGQFDFW